MGADVTPLLLCAVQPSANYEVVTFTHWSSRPKKRRRYSKSFQAYLLLFSQRQRFQTTSSSATYLVNTDLGIKGKALRGYVHPSSYQHKTEKKRLEGKIILLSYVLPFLGRAQVSITLLPDV